MPLLKRLLYTVSVPSGALLLGFGYLNLQYSSMMVPARKV